MGGKQHEPGECFVGERVVTIPESSDVVDRVLERARGRQRPLMPNDETVIRVLCDEVIAQMKSRGDWPPKAGEDHLVDFLVAAIGGLEFELGKQGGFKL